MTASSKSKTTDKGAGKAAGGGAKAAIDAWKKDGEREDQDYYHVPGAPGRDRKEVHSDTRGQKPRKS